MDKTLYKLRRISQIIQRDDAASLKLERIRDRYERQRLCRPSNPGAPRAGSTNILGEVPPMPTKHLFGLSDAELEMILVAAVEPGLTTVELKQRLVIRKKHSVVVRLLTSLCLQGMLRKRRFGKRLKWYVGPNGTEAIQLIQV